MIVQPSWLKVSYIDFWLWQCNPYYHHQYKVVVNTWNVSPYRPSHVFSFTSIYQETMAAWAVWLLNEEHFLWSFFTVVRYTVSSGKGATGQEYCEDCGSSGGSSGGDFRATVVLLSVCLPSKAEQQHFCTVKAFICFCWSVIEEHKNVCKHCVKKNGTRGSGMLVLFLQISSFFLLFGCSPKKV